MLSVFRLSNEATRVIVSGAATAQDPRSPSHGPSSDAAPVPRCAGDLTQPVGPQSFSLNTRYGSSGCPCHHFPSAFSSKIAKCRCGVLGGALPDVPT